MKTIRIYRTTNGSERDKPESFHDISTRSIRLSFEHAGRTWIVAPSLYRTSSKYECIYDRLTGLAATASFKSSDRQCYIDFLKSISVDEVSRAVEPFPEVNHA